jgi:hypothetical protein
VKRKWRNVLLTIAALTGIPAVVIGAFWLYSSSEVITYDGIEGGALVSPDGRTISVSAEGVCEQVITLDATETQEAVVIRLRYARPRNVQCGGVGIYAVFRARLVLPLGRRRLIDGVTGRLVPHLDFEAIRRPGYVPPGYTFRYDQPGTGASPEFPFPMVTSHGRMTATEVFGTSDDRWLFITQQPVVPVRWPAGLKARAVTVHGHRATAAAGRLLTWNQDGLRFTVAAAPAIPLSELLAIANSIRR